MLTRQQKSLLDFIAARLKDTGVTPSYEEMQAALQLKSKSGIHRLVSGLEERGFIRRLPRKARALEVLRTEAPVPASKKRTPHALAPDLPLPAVIELPLYGRIAAGTAMEAHAANDETITVPVSLLGGAKAVSGKHYALRVRGDSMIDDGINDGDIAMIYATDKAETGQIVVALIDDHEATLKHFHRKGDEVVLRAANAAYADMHFKAAQVKVQGRLVGLWRRY